MITVSTDQLDSMRGQRLDTFCQELTVSVRERHGEACDPWDDETLFYKLREEITFADAQGFKKRDVLERYADLAVAVGFGFGVSEKWAVDILEDFGGPAWKMDQLERAAVFVVRGRE